MKLFSKNRKRITAAVLSALLLCAAPLSYADDTVADMEAKQTELANKKADLENKISSLESQEADKTEYLTLRRALMKYTENAVVLIVAQRVSTIMNAEQIIVLDEGKIVGKGTHKELLKTCSEYREIAESQLSKEELA